MDLFTLRGRLMTVLLLVRTKAAETNASARAGEWRMLLLQREARGEGFSASEAEEMAKAPGLPGCLSLSRFVRTPSLRLHTRKILLFPEKNSFVLGTPTPAAPPADTYAHSLILQLHFTFAAQAHMCTHVHTCAHMCTHVHASTDSHF